MGWFFVAASSLFALFVGATLWRTLATGTASMLGLDDGVKRDEKPVLFWFVVVALAVILANAVWIGVNAAVDFNLLGRS